MFCTGFFFYEGSGSGSGVATTWTEADDPPRMGFRTRMVSRSAVSDASANAAETFGTGLLPFFASTITFTCSSARVN